MNKYCVYWIDGGKAIVRADCTDDAVFRACMLHCRTRGDIDRVAVWI